LSQSAFFFSAGKVSVEEAIQRIAISAERIADSLETIAKCSSAATHGYLVGEISDSDRDVAQQPKSQTQSAEL